MIDTFELKVNDDTRDYKKIKTIYMTAPYLKAVDGGHRMLKLKTADAPKPLEYTVMKRPEKTILNDDEYSRLYNSIRKMCEVQGIKFDPYGTDF